MSANVILFKASKIPSATRKEIKGQNVSDVYERYGLSYYVASVCDRKNIFDEIDSDVSPVELSKTVTNFERCFEENGGAGHGKLLVISYLRDYMQATYQDETVVRVNRETLNKYAETKKELCYVYDETRVFDDDVSPDVIACIRDYLDKVCLAIYDEKYTTYYPVRLFKKRVYDLTKSIAELVYKNDDFKYRDCNGELRLLSALLAEDDLYIEIRN